MKSAVFYKTCQFSVFVEHQNQQQKAFFFLTFGRWSLISALIYVRVSTVLPDFISFEFIDANHELDRRTAWLGWTLTCIVHRDLYFKQHFILSFFLF